MALCYF